MPLLVIERGEGKGTSVKVEPGKRYVVGRENAQSAVPIKDPLASRNHFEIREENGGWVIEDLKSRNGTVLNDDRLSAPTPIKIGDKIQVGETILSFLSDEKEESAGGLVGKVIGGYRILERLGRGGMGTVYKAEQMSLHRVVALKVLSAKLLSDATFVEKFVAEARAAGQLNHPNIVQVFDVGSDRGVHYFSMELMEPESVGDLVAKQGPIPWDQALGMMMDAAKGLIYAEKRGIVHRDIKPDNLMRTAEGTVKIGDLGLARQAGDSQGEGGAIFGTPHFIAPEQAQGKPIDNRADIYSLGATFYRVLSGKTPFTGENVKEILLKQINADPVPLQKVVADLPEEMALIVEKMMKKRPDDRYRSAQGLLDDLERVRIRYHLESHGLSAGAKRTKILAAVLAIALIGVGIFAYRLATRPEPAPVTPVILPTGPAPVNPQPVEKTPEEKADEAFAVVDREDLEFSLKAKGRDPLDTNTWQTMAKGWEDVAARHEALAKEHPGTSAAARSAERAAYIRERMQRARAADEKRRTDAIAAWEAEKARVEGLVTEGRAGVLLTTIDASLETLRQRHREYLPEGIEKFLRDARDRALAGAATRLQAAAAALDRAAGEYPGDAFAAAAERARAAAAHVRPPAGTPSPKDIEDLVAGLERSRRNAEKVARATAARVLNADADTFVRGYLEVRRWSPADQPRDADSTPFFDYRWDDAIRRLEEIRASLRVPHFRDRAAAKIGHYGRCRRLFEWLRDRINAGEFRDPGFPAEFRKGATALILDRSPGARPATTEGCAVERRVAGARKSEWLEFRRMTPREFFVDFLKEGHGLDAPGQTLLDLSVFMAEAGEGLHAVALQAAAGRAREPASPEPALSAWIAAEIGAFTRFAGPGGIVEEYDKYLRSREEGAPAKTLELLRQGIAGRVRAFLHDPAVRATDYYLLHASSIATADGGARSVAHLPEGLLESTLAAYGLAPEGGGHAPGATSPANGGGAEGETQPPTGGDGSGRGGTAGAGDDPKDGGGGQDPPPAPPAPAPGTSPPKSEENPE